MNPHLNKELNRRCIGALTGSVSMISLMGFLIATGSAGEVSGRLETLRNQTILSRFKRLKRNKDRSDRVSSPLPLPNRKINTFQGNSNPTQSLSMATHIISQLEVDWQAAVLF
jgi:hypothetical protein